MAAPTTVLVTVSPEAAARVAELGMQAELDRMIEHTRQTVLSLRRIDVVIEPVYDTHDETGIRIEAVQAGAYPDDGSTEWEWHEWLVAAFPPHVYSNFAVLVRYEDAHGG
jgi:hypothetical protein